MKTISPAPASFSPDCRGPTTVTTGKLSAARKNSARISRAIIMMHECFSEKSANSGRNVE